MGSLNNFQDLFCLIVFSNGVPINQWVEKRVLKEEIERVCNNKNSVKTFCVVDGCMFILPEPLLYLTVNTNNVCLVLFSSVPPSSSRWRCWCWSWWPGGGGRCRTSCRTLAGIKLNILNKYSFFFYFQFIDLNVSYNFIYFIREKKKKKFFNVVGETRKLGHIRSSKLLPSL